MDLKELHTLHFKSIIGQTNYFDIIFDDSGNYKHRSAPCGNNESTQDYRWEEVSFARSLNDLKCFNLSNLPNAKESVIVVHNRCRTTFSGSRTQ